MYARLQIFIQLSPMKLCHIKRAYLVHNHNVRKMSKTCAFGRLRMSLIALLIAVCGKSL